MHFKHEQTTDKYVPTVMFDRYYIILYRFILCKINIYDRYLIVIMVRFICRIIRLFGLFVQRIYCYVNSD